MPGLGAQVDVAVVTWNTRDLTVKALRHLADSPGDLNLRLLVRDNGSSDGTAEAIAAAVPTAELDAGADNLGFAGGVNTLLARSTAPWVLLLNSDAWPEPGAIEALVACAERHPRAAAIAPLLRRPDGALEHSTWPFPSLRNAAGGIRRTGGYAWAHDEEREVDWAVGAALLLRRAALDAVGPLDETLFMYAEDLEWCWRARDAGWEIWFCPEAVVRHVGNASGAQLYGDRRAEAWIANSVRVYRRRHGALATTLWRLTNAVGAAVAARRATPVDAELSRHRRAQVRVWLRAP
ncbi:MAG TPA: glycosyltransferase family 2 protein [Mycobacteriales bacterium]|nr:glycosyltransferase family 2 protein [Mycobacteriales bacterium]